MKSKKGIKECYKHFARRWNERINSKPMDYYNIDNRYNKIGNMIRNGEAKHIEKESNSRSHFLVFLDNISFIVVYNRLINLPVTILPQEEKCLIQ